MIYLFYAIVGTCKAVGWLPRGLMPYSDVMYNLAFVLSCLFGFYLAFHTKLIVGQKRYTNFQVNEQDYMFGAIGVWYSLLFNVLDILEPIVSQLV